MKERKEISISSQSAKKVNSSLTHTFLPLPKTHCLREIMHFWQSCSYWLETIQNLSGDLSLTDSCVKMNVGGQKAEDMTMRASKFESLKNPPFKSNNVSHKRSWWALTTGIREVYKICVTIIFPLRAEINWICPHLSTVSLL